MTYLLDTNIISEIRKGPRCNATVAAWYNSIDDADIFLSVLIIGEIRKGLERVRHSDPNRARSLERWLTMVERSFADRILPIDQAIANEWGRMTATRAVSTVDALLAATAVVNGMTLVTRNFKDVANLGAKVLNPFDR